MKLNYYRHPLALVHEWNIANVSKRSKQDPLSCADTVLLVTLEDEAGLRGWGEASPAGRYGEDIPSCEAFLNRVDPNALDFNHIALSRERLQAMAPFNRSAAGAVEVALLDGAARLAKQPLHEFLGLALPDPPLTTSFSIGLDKPEIIEKKVLEAGPFPLLKLKVGGPRDRENFDALRRAAPRKTVRLDANEGWKTKEEALRNLEWFARDGKVEFVEQPLPSNSPLEDHAWLKQRSPLPIFADESCLTAGDVEPCAEGFHGVNVKLVKTAGPIEAKKTLQAASAAGLKTMLGCMVETSVLIAAAAHLASLADYLDLDGNLLISNDPFEGVLVRDGKLSFGEDGPGAGLGVRRKE